MKSIAKGRSLLMALVVAFAMPALEARAVEAPDAETLAGLQDRFPIGRTARVRTSGAERLVLSPVFSPEGIREVDRDGVITMTPWSQIEQVDARGGRPVRGAVVGGVLGAGGGVALGYISALSNDGDNALGSIIGATALFATAGAVVGAGIGSLFPGWVKVYPGRLTRGSSWGVGRRK